MAVTSNYIAVADITNFPSGASDTLKQSRFNRAEQVIEKVTHDIFYSKSFDETINGNGSDRIYLGLAPKILSVVTLIIFNSTINTDTYSNDEQSVFRSPGTTPSPEFFEKGCLFPKGLNNVQVTGTHGYTITPELIQRAVIVLIEDMNDSTLHGKMMEGSENADGYSYKNPNEAWTGIKEVDDILEMYMNRRPIVRG